MMLRIRWRIELVYRELKHTLDIENIRSHSFLGVHKEIPACQSLGAGRVAQLMANNLVRYTMQEAAIKYGSGALRHDARGAHSDARLSVNYSFKRAFSGMKKIMEIAICMARLDIQQVYENLQREIVRYRVIERPGRSYPRLFTSRAKKRREKMKEKILQMLKEALNA